MPTTEQMRPSDPISISYTTKRKTYLAPLPRPEPLAEPLNPPPRPSEELTPRPSPENGGPLRPRLAGLSPLSFLVSTMIFKVSPPPMSTLTPPSPPATGGSDKIIARLAASTVVNSAKAQALYRTTSTVPFRGPKRVSACVSACEEIGSVTL